MQLTNSATIVDFFPEAFIAESCEKKGMKVTIKRFVKRVTFRANGMKSTAQFLQLMQNMSGSSVLLRVLR